MDIDLVRREIEEFLNFRIPDIIPNFTAFERVNADGYTRLRISYASEEGDEIPAYLLQPEGDGPFAAVLVHHQHASQRHFGKSEVCGLVGNPLQAFGPALARRGIVVLAPDSICFEDRRKNRTGTEPDEEADIAQHFNEMCYRLLRGDTLMRKVLCDSAQGISLLQSIPQVNSERLGILGHSYGGNTVLFHGALDERIRFACSSGAVCSYRYKMANQVGIEMAEAIPGFVTRFDIPDLVACFASCRLLVVSATDDVFSFDAAQMVDAANVLNPNAQLEHKRCEGGHALTQERFDAIINWLVERAGGI
jgi:dienelactone hydrolase